MNNVQGHMDKVMDRIKVYSSERLKRIILSFNQDDWLAIYYKHIVERSSIVLIWREKYYITGRGLIAPMTVRFKNRKHYGI